MSGKRNLFAELMEGMDALQGERTGKTTLRRVEVEYKPPVAMSAEEVVEVRRKLNLSQPVLARSLRTEVKTLKNWEQGRSRPNAQAAILLKLVEKHPELIDEIAAM